MDERIVLGLVGSQIRGLAYRVSNLAVLKTAEDERQKISMGLYGLANKIDPKPKSK